MKSSTGRWVIGEDFFDREGDLKNLKRLVQDHHHVLLTGQRRMGKTSVARELSRQLEAEGWTCLFCDAEAATSPEDLIAEIAYAAQPVTSLLSRAWTKMRRYSDEKFEEVGVSHLRLKVRTGIDAANWKRQGEQLFRKCKAHDQSVLLVIDELPIFLQRILASDQGPQRVDGFLSWLRAVTQHLGKNGPVLMVSGSIGLQPFVNRLGIPDRINYLYPYRLGPWDKTTSVRCFKHLAKTNKLPIANGVAEAVYEALGIGIPHHIQSFFERLRDYAAIHELNLVSVQDVDTVYRTNLLGPTGQLDLHHYNSRLQDALPEATYRIALLILAEAAIQDVFTRKARASLERRYGRIDKEVQKHVAEALDVLEHDGYLVADNDGHRFCFRLLKEWWAVRFRDHYTPLDDRGNKDYLNEAVK